MSVRCGVVHVVCSNVMWNVMQWWCDVEWCDVEWCVVEWCDVKGGVMYFWCGVME